MTRLLIALWIVVGSLFGVATADTREPLPAAKPHVEAGVKAYSAGLRHVDAGEREAASRELETASREFETAYGIDPDPTLLYAWAQARRFGNHCDEAIGLYQRYLESNPTENQITAAKTGISLCEQTRPLPPPKVDSPRPPPPVVPRVEPKRWYKDPVGGALVIGGGLAAGVGAAFLVLAKRSDDAADRAEFRDDFLELLDQATMRRRIGYTGVGVGAVLVIAGIVRYATHGDEPTNVAVTASGSSLVVFGRF